MPQSATFTPFSVAIPAVSHFVALSFSQKTRGNLWKISKTSNIESLSVKKKVVP